MSAKLTLLSFFALALFVSCRSDSSDTGSPSYLRSQLLGRWELVKALRNKKPTETLTGTYYEFLPDGKMKTNLTPTTIEQTYEYEFMGQEFKQLSEPPIVFSIDSLSEQTLGLSMVLLKYDFKLELRRVVPPVLPTEKDSTSTLKEL